MSNNTITVSAVTALIAAGINLGEQFPGGVTIVPDSEATVWAGVPETAPEPAQEAPKAPRTRKDKPINRTNREAAVRAMTREGWEGHEHMSAKALVELLREAGDCPKGFYLPTGAVKDAIAAAKNA